MQRGPKSHPVTKVLCYVHLLPRFSWGCRTKQERGLSTAQAQAGGASVGGQPLGKLLLPRSSNSTAPLRATQKIQLEGCSINARSPDLSLFPKISVHCQQHTASCNLGGRGMAGASSPPWLPWQDWCRTHSMLHPAAPPPGACKCSPSHRAS